MPFRRACWMRECKKNNTSPARLVTFWTPEADHCVRRGHGGEPRTIRNIAIGDNALVERRSAGEGGR